MTCNHGSLIFTKYKNILCDSVKLFLQNTCSHKIVLKKDLHKRIIS